MYIKVLSNDQYIYGTILFRLLPSNLNLVQNLREYQKLRSKKKREIYERTNGQIYIIPKGATNSSHTLHILRQRQPTSAIIVNLTGKCAQWIRFGSFCFFSHSRSVIASSHALVWLVPKISKFLLANRCVFHIEIFRRWNCANNFFFSFVPRDHLSNTQHYFFFNRFHRQGNMRWNFFFVMRCHKHKSQTTFDDNTFQTGLVGWKRR